jgi:hypothetical protein
MEVDVCAHGYSVQNTEECPGCIKYRERTKVLEELREWADRLLTNWALSAEKPERIVLIENFKKEFLTEMKGER